MRTKVRRGLFRGALAAGIVAALFIGTAVVAAAHSPGPGGTTQDGWVFVNLVGYKSPPANYTVGDAFTFSVDAYNETDTSRDGCFRLEVYHLAALNANTPYTEAQLENMVNTTNTQEMLVFSTEFTKSFTAHQKQVLTTGFTVTVAGYYQFDMGECGTGPFAPRSGYNGPPVSGLVRYLPAAGTSASGVSGSTTTTTTTTSTSAAVLAGTGGGPTAPIGAGLLLLAGLSLIAAGLSTRRRAVR
jgi:hypothetical protein